MAARPGAPSAESRLHQQLLPGSWRLAPEYMVILQGGVQVLVKPDDRRSELLAAVKREVAAWEVAKRLGFAELVGATVLREVPLTTDPEQLTLGSVQVVWPIPDPNAPPPPIPSLDPDEVWKAAVFDVVTHAGDRSHNWLGVSDPPALKLYDHGHSFELPGSSFQSAFFDACADQPIPDYLVKTLERYVLAGMGNYVVELLGEEQAQAIVDRTKRLLEALQMVRP